MMRYLLKRLRANPRLDPETGWQDSIRQILGEEALDLEGLAEKRRRYTRGEAAPAGLADFFFDPEAFGEEEDGEDDADE